MNLEGNYEIKAPMEKVWEFINDPNKIGNCFPDVKSLEVKDQDNFTAVARVGIGFIKGDFKFRVAVVERTPPSHARLKATGAGSGSSVDIDLAIDLTKVPEGTKLQYNAVTRVGGVMAGLGQSLVENAAKKTINQVFDSLKKNLQA